MGPYWHSLLGSLLSIFYVFKDLNLDIYIYIYYLIIIGMLSHYPNSNESTSITLYGSQPTCMGGVHPIHI